MKPYKHIIYIFLSIGIMVGSSCDDFLLENPATLTTEAELTSEDAARAYANGAYANLNVLDRGSGQYGGNTLELIEFITGKSDGIAQSRAFEYNNLTLNSDAFYIDTWWNDLYSGIKSANLAISILEEKFSTLDEEVKSNYLAEVKTLRAFYYFYLVRIFGPVPKITEIVKSLGDVNTPRSPEKEIYDDIIIPDLLSAEKSSLPWRESSGRVSMGFVKSLLADVYLTYAGFPVQGGNQYYAESAKRSKEVIGSDVFSLFKEYTDMIDPSNDNSGGFIFQIQYDKENRTNPLTEITMPPGLDISPAYNEEYGALVPRPEFLTNYQTGDKRNEEKQFFYSNYNGIDFNGRYIYKYFDKKAVDDDARSELNFTVYRLADVMLLYAEASNQAEDGPNSDAIKYVNDIRERANLPTIGSMDMENFEKEVWMQRYLELCFEGKMWFDMIRTRKVYNDETKKWEDLIGHTNVFGATYSMKNLLFPIPLREMQSNVDLVQNEGY